MPTSTNKGHHRFANSNRPAKFCLKIETKPVVITLPPSWSEVLASLNLLACITGELKFEDPGADLFRISESPSGITFLQSIRSTDLPCYSLHVNSLSWKYSLALAEYLSPGPLLLSERLLSEGLTLSQRVPAEPFLFLADPNKVQVFHRCFPTGPSAHDSCDSDATNSSGSPTQQDLLNHHESRRLQLT